MTNTFGASRAGIKKLAASPRMAFKGDDDDQKKREGKVPNNLYQRRKMKVSRYVKPCHCDNTTRVVKVLFK